MASHPGSLTGLLKPVVFATDERIASHYARVRVTNLPDPDSTITALNPPGGRAGQGVQVVGHVPTPPAPISHVGCLEERSSFSYDWFEKFHVRPGQFVLGNVLSTQQINVSVYSAYRRDDHTWDAFVNNAGDGVSLLNAPSLPYEFPPQTGYPNLLLEVTPNGPPVVNSTLDFVFDTMTISPIITLERLTLFDLPPELPYTETLEFLTEIQLHRDGGEHRIALRKNPRQLFEWNLILEDSFERSRIHNLLFDWHARAFGVPVWHEATFSTAAATATDTSIAVRTTSFADYREGKLVLVYDSSTKFDVMEVAVGGIGANALTFTNGLQNSYGVRTLVMPLRAGVLTPNVGGSRFTSDAAKLSLRFRVTDNDSNLSDVSGWTAYNSKVVLDDVNSTGGSDNSVVEEFARDLIVTDNATGLATITSIWPHDKRRHTKTFWTRTPEELWKVRQLLHALRGRQVSFYLPTKGQDLVAVDPLTATSTNLVIRNVGYSRYVRNRQTRNIIQVIFNDGTAPLQREITASSELSSTQESLTVDVAWPTTKAISTIARIEYLELSRFDSDNLRFSYALGDRTCRISAPVTTVFDE